MAGVSSAAAAGSGSSSSSRVKWLTDLDKSAIVSNFEKRGWVKGSLEGVARKQSHVTSRDFSSFSPQMVTGIFTSAVCTRPGLCSTSTPVSDSPMTSKNWNPRMKTRGNG